MSNIFANYSGVITGAAQGIGLTLAEHLLKKGARVLLNDKDDKALIQAEKFLQAWEGQFIIHAADASIKSQVNNTVDIAHKKFGRLDFAIANAGITKMGPFLDFPESELRMMFDLNLAGTFFLAQAASKIMIQQNEGGRIIFMSSTTGIQAHRNMEGYGMTKAALQLLAKNLGPELGPYGITVNCVAPGATATPRTTEVGPQYADGWSQVIPSGRASSTDDVAEACLFLLSSKARQINGQTLIVDGGWTGTSPLPDDI